MRRKKEASKVKQTNKTKQHSTPKVVTFPRKNELLQVGLEPMTLYRVCTLTLWSRERTCWVEAIRKSLALTIIITAPQLLGYHKGKSPIKVGIHSNIIGQGSHFQC